MSTVIDGMRMVVKSGTGLRANVGIDEIFRGLGSADRLFERGRCRDRACRVHFVFVFAELDSLRLNYVGHGNQQRF